MPVLQLPISVGIFLISKLFAFTLERLFHFKFDCPLCVSHAVTVPPPRPLAILGLGRVRVILSLRPFSCVQFALKEGTVQQIEMCPTSPDSRVARLAGGRNVGQFRRRPLRREVGTLLDEGSGRGFLSSARAVTSAGWDDLRKSALARVIGFL